MYAYWVQSNNQCRVIEDVLIYKKDEKKLGPKYKLEKIIEFKIFKTKVLTTKPKNFWADDKHNWQFYWENDVRKDKDNNALRHNNRFRYLWNIGHSALTTYAWDVVYSEMQ